MEKLFVDGVKLGGRAFVGQPAGQPSRQPEEAGARVREVLQHAQAAQAAGRREELSALPIRELKGMLDAASIVYAGCTEKRELIDLVILYEAADCSASGSAQPAAPVDERADERQCIVCGAARGAGVKLKRCGGCLGDQVLFCSGACQTAFWPQHKAACKAAQRAARGR